jgi:CheY-like chemotaxis protein
MAVTVVGGSGPLVYRTSERERGSDGISACPTDRAVLILDDDRDVAQTIQELVEDQGFRAIHASNGREALALLEKMHPCLMLIDVFMPVMNGVEFLKVVRSNDALAGIPRVLMTAANDQMIGVKEDAPVLYKPVDFESLKRILHKYCAPHAPRSR